MGSSWSDRIETLALGEGLVVVQKDGTAWWSSIPAELAYILDDGPWCKGPIDYVALGGDGYFFAQFHDGSWELEGPSDLCQLLQDRSGDAELELLVFVPSERRFVL